MIFYLFASKVCKKKNYWLIVQIKSKNRNISYTRIQYGDTVWFKDSFNYYADTKLGQQKVAFNKDNYFFNNCMFDIFYIHLWLIFIWVYISHKYFLDHVFDSTTCCTVTATFTSDETKESVCIQLGNQILLQLSVCKAEAIYT